MAVKHRLYLRVGDHVAHRDHEEWGTGTVVEQMTSVLEGGTCLVRVNFADGQQRTFDNNLDSQSCCYFFGLRRQRRPEGADQPKSALVVPPVGISKRAD